MVKNTTLSKFQAAMAAEVDAESEYTGRRYTTLAEIGDAVRESCTAETLLGEIVGRVRTVAAQDDLVISEAEIRDEAERIQASLRAESDTFSGDAADFRPLDSDERKPAPSYLADLAERMVRDRPAGDGHVGDPFDGMELDIDPADAFGLVQAAIIAWLEERGRWASPMEIRHTVDALMAQAQEARPGPIKAGVYTVEAGVVTGFTPDPEPAELPEMPARPEPTNALTVPSDSIFGDDGEFVISQPLTNRARVLIERHPDHLEHLDGHKISVLYLWKKQGGKGKGRATFGKCSKPSGLLKHFSEAHFVIWLAADHCRAAGYRDRELEALLFHEMLHTAVTEPDENTGRGGGPALVPHDLEVFRAEVEIYGLWAPDLKEVGPAFQQVSLFDTAAAATYPDPITIEYDSEIGREEAAEAGYVENPLSGAGQLIRPDGTPLTEEEIAEQEAAELRDDPAEFDEDEDPG